MDLVEKMGLPLAEAGSRLGVSTSAISKIMMRPREIYLSHACQQRPVSQRPVS